MLPGLCEKRFSATLRPERMSRPGNRPHTALAELRFDRVEAADELFFDASLGGSGRLRHPPILRRIGGSQKDERK